MTATAEYVFQTGISPASQETYAVDETLTHCPVSHDLLDVQYEWDKLPVPLGLAALFACRGEVVLGLLAGRPISRFTHLASILLYIERRQSIDVGESQKFRDNDASAVP